jgi:hypothetical protein
MNPFKQGWFLYLLIFIYKKKNHFPQLLGLSKFIRHIFNDIFSLLIKIYKIK